EEIDAVQKTYVKEPVDKLIENIQDEILENPHLFQTESYIQFLNSAMQMTPFELKFYKGTELVLYVEQHRKNPDEMLSIIREGVFSDGEGNEYSYEVALKLREPKDSFVSRFNQKVMENAILFLVIYGILHFIFFKYTLRTVFGPLDRMKRAAIHIKDEEYDEALEYDGSDEVGEVFQAFDEMRLRIKETDEIRQQYEENRKELIANISHDLKTPITAINGYVQGILDGVANTDEKLHSYIETIAVYGRDMDTLIDDLSLLSKLDLDGILFQFESVRLVNYIKDCMEELNFDLEEKGIQTSLHVNIEKDALVSIDGAQIKRVMNNIIFNAVKHFDKEEARLEITVAESVRGAYYEIRIQDNGVGIPKEKIDNIFERFYRADESRNSETGGSGLGLSIARQIIKAHGGTIWADSEVGIGTTIGFTLPKL
ncbi:MAG: HAMP domain-containing histidine kinase, partial [Clostridia bacterium]|nr:HAMP domain-containing histidine kinase [Clostridia bacterium]